MKIAVAGNQGSFSHEAGMLYCAGRELQDCDLFFALDSAGVFQALEKGTVELGIMPIYNPTGGLVDMTMVALGQHQFIMEASFTMPVVQCLLNLPRVRPDVVMKIVSHQQAIKQCQQYLDLNWPECLLQDYSDTAQAAADLAGGKLPTETAVIAPKLCAELYGLRLIAEGIQDDKDNQTVFIVVKNSQPK